MVNKENVWSVQLQHFNPGPGNCRQHGVNKTELRWVKQRIKDPLSTNPRARDDVTRSEYKLSSNRTV
jgi:hypothetical protein